MTATSNNYADALFMLAREENSVDAIFSDLETIKKAFAENPEYEQFLSAPSISKADRFASIESVFGGRVNTHTLSFLQLLCEKGKIAGIDDIASEFERLREWASGTAEAVVKTAVELSESQKQSLISALEKRTGKKIVLKTVTDKSVLGGLTVEIDGELIDGSVKSNLKRVREVISV